MQHISVSSFKEVIQAEKENPSVDFINVCTPAEYKEAHIEGVRNVPFADILTHAQEFVGTKTIYVHCNSGDRSRKAIAALSTAGVQAQLVNVEGGLSAWNEAGFDTLSLTTRLPIMRQVMLTAGVLILTGVALSYVNPQFILLTAFVGAGLSFAGVTGWCGMNMLLSRMPWNR